MGEDFSKSATWVMAKVGIRRIGLVSLASSLLLCVLVLVFRGTAPVASDTGAEQPTEQFAAGEMNPGRGGASAGSPQQRLRVRPNRDPEDDEGDDECPQFPLVDAILSDESLTLRDSARSMYEIVSRQDVSLMEREEALAHGLNLDMKLFEEMVDASLIPQPLALRYFDAVLNQNDSRDFQVRSCLSLLNHSDAEIRQEAAEQLAFYIGLEEHDEDHDLLRQEAAAFLEELPEQVKVPQDITADQEIPETAPIGPVQGGMDEEEESALSDD